MRKNFYLPLFYFLISMFILPLLAEIPESSLKLFPPMNVIYHPVSTSNEEAQRSFDKGLTYIFAFNHDIAFNAFEYAAKIDPNLAMAYWGMALALGQNINEDIKPQNEKRCYDYIQKALQLSPKASTNEQAYISALATRYSNDPNIDRISLRFAYRNAMKKVVEEYPEDLDAATLYAESILNLDPWKWWQGGKANPGTYEAIDKLEFVLMRNPDHLGANHYYVHAMEESPFPERALMSAHRLQSLLPESGHLLHMPCHIFLLVGDYESALKTNQKAIARDRNYIQKFGMGGNYPLHYLKHNLYVLTRIYMLMEDYPNAMQAAYELTNFINPYVQSMPDLAMYLRVPLEVLLYFHRWNEILRYSQPSTYPPILAYWHYCRATAYASLNNADAAQKEKELMLQAKDRITDEDLIANNPASKVLDLAETLLDAALAQAQIRDAESIAYLKKAVSLQDELFYDEPPAWPVPVRQLLGFALLRQKEFAEAEKTFQTTLKSLQRNGRSLFGLFQSLKGQGKKIEAYWVEREMKAALKHASGSIKVE